MTEITENHGRTLFYDGECQLCISGIQRVRCLLARREIQCTALQAAGVAEQLGLTPEHLLLEMKFRDTTGTVHGGADAYVALARLYWWAWPLYLLAHFPGARLLLRWGYKRLAAKRYCISGRCERPRARGRIPVLVWLMAVLFPLVTLPFRELLPAWGFMWALAWTMFFGYKGLTWYAARTPEHKTISNAIRYFLLWPGMEPEPFLRPRRAIVTPVRDWIFACAKIALGIVLVWTVAHRVAEANAMVAAWIGMIGVTFILHFGLFHLLALVWKRAGVPVEPLMNNPVRATALSEFWGRRWNRGFNQLVHRFLFRPTVRHLNVAGATMLTFAVSGIIHDVVISVPARGGYGLPTLYFLLQGAGVLMERSKFGRVLGLDRGIRGWLFMALFTVAPAYWLFHPPFIDKVILPMLQAIGATGVPL